MDLKSFRQLGLRGVRLLVIVGMLFATQPNGGLHAGAQTDEFERLSRQIDSYMQDIEILRDRLDRTHFDLESLSFELAFEDAETIAGWVRDEIAYQAYPGLLRGASGTLIDGAGNALDQAVLLATLLRDAGFEAEIRLGKLSRGLSEILVAQLGQSEVQTTNFDIETPFGLDTDQVAQLREKAVELFADLQAQSTVAAALVEGRVQLGDGDLDAVVEEAREYAWVEYRLSPNDPWRTAHPAFADSLDAPGELAATASLTDEVPTELQHRFRIQAWIERKLGDRLEATPVMEAWERPVANLTGEVLTFTTYPDGFAEVDDPGDAAAVLGATDFFFPIFEDDLAPGGQAFDLNGNVLPPDAAADAMAAVFQTVGERIGDAIGTLGNLGDNTPASDPAVTLTAQWIEFVLIAPGGAETVHRRYVFDRIGAANRTDGIVELGVQLGEEEVLEALQTAQTIMLAPGRYSAPYVQDRGMAMTLASHAYLDGVLESLYQGADPPSVPADLAEENAATGPLNLFTLFDDPPLDEGVISYRPAPALLVMSQRLDRSHALVDIVANPRLSFSGSADGDLPTPDPFSTLLAGVWETRTETLPFEAVGADVFNTIPVVRAADEAGIELVTLHPGDPNPLSDLEIPAASRTAIAEDLVRGFTVIVPQELAPGHEFAAWWRIDPLTGETLGRGIDGRGPSFVEFLTTFEVSVTITAAFAVAGAAMCTDLPPREAGCCLIQNVVLAGAGVGLGVVLVEIYAIAALTAFFIADVGWNVGSLFLPTFCPG